ncbi:transcription factor bHLH19-like [Triticum urartu]|uniref:BHLH domain-containing protein n=1 Tax=Triticum urartu TaxID=4572 RepID=A0A8R7U3V8_TRIUA|nr:transcription factor bHLH19-like [Triticum urartu]XP_048569172.1 transcription factor bHLH19-like [Triticum urartu]XP_048569173.1 transcription factor bHLH19-like [Triticum urartu]XP_048569174.1 transcription factor bHLH19-like [Triticum urartu]
MDDSALFMEWAMDTLEQEHPDPVVVHVNGDSGEAAFPSLQALREQRLLFEELITGANPANSASSGETTDGSGGSGNFSSPAAMEHDVWRPSPNSARCAPKLCRNGGGTSLPVTSWNFCAASALPASDGTLDSGSAGAGPVVPEMVYGSQPTRRTAARSPTSTGPVSSGPPYAQDHIMAERKRREKINQRFIELSTVIPGLKKMDKATILSDATRHVKELQEKIKALEAAAGRSSRSNETVVLIKKKPRHADAALSDQNGLTSSASSGAPSGGNNPLPEIEVRFSETGVMVRILCHDVQGVVVRVLSEVEEGLHLTVTHANVMPFTACTVIITITAKVDEGFTVTAEEIVGRLNSVLQLHSSCTSTDEK